MGNSEWMENYTAPPDLSLVEHAKFYIVRSVLELETSRAHIVSDRD